MALTYRDLEQKISKLPVWAKDKFVRIRSLDHSIHITVHEEEFVASDYLHNDIRIFVEQPQENE